MQHLVYECMQDMSEEVGLGWVQMCFLYLLPEGEGDDYWVSQTLDDVWAGRLADGLSFRRVCRSDEQSWQHPVILCHQQNGRK